MPSLTIKNATFFAGYEKKEIIKIENQVFSSRINFITGSNGVGKSTLLYALSSIFPNFSYKGNIILNGQTLDRKRVGLVRQNPSDSIIPDLTFEENIIFSRLSVIDCLSLKKLNSKKNKLQVYNFLKKLNFCDENIITKKAEELSGGQKQLLAVLMRVYRGVELLLLDEVTASLDRDNIEIVMDLIKELALSARIIILFVTHQQNLLKEELGCVFLLENKKVSLRN